MKSVYDAKDPSEGCRSILRALPSWFLPVTVSGIMIGYAVSLEFRLLLARWRNAQRSRIMERYRSLEVGDSRSSHEIDLFKPDTYVDPSQVSPEDVEEFRMALGLVIPRDEDLIQLVEKMLIEDPIPEEWQLYRCSFGGLRFRNIETEEIKFYHDGSKEIESIITSEVKKRDVVQMEKYGAHMFQSSNQIENEKPSVKDSRPKNRFIFESITTSPSEEPDPIPPAEDGIGNSFQAVFNYFINKEKNALENEVTQSFSLEGKKRSFFSGSSRENRGMATPLCGSMRMSNNTGVGFSHPGGSFRSRVSTPETGSQKPSWLSSKPPLAPLHSS
eukprot:Tbor_TRINITY_DN4497_c1_g3::TRINITY_DN4497_c1_g3_i1::g.8089::m.8089